MDKFRLVLALREHCISHADEMRNRISPPVQRQAAKPLHVDLTLGVAGGGTVVRVVVDDGLLLVLLGLASASHLWTGLEAGGFGQTRHIINVHTDQVAVPVVASRGIGPRRLLVNGVANVELLSADRGLAATPAEESGKRLLLLTCLSITLVIIFVQVTQPGHGRDSAPCETAKLHA